MDGTFHQSVVRGRAPKHRGLLLGEVVSVQAVSAPSPSSSSAKKQGTTVTTSSTTKAGGSTKKTKQKERNCSSNNKHSSSSSSSKDGGQDAYAVVVALKHDVRRGDGVVFDVGRPEDNELGGRVFGVWPSIGGGSGGRLRDELAEGGSAGDTVCLTFDNSMSARLRRHVTPGIGKKANKVQNDKAPRLKVHKVASTLHINIPFRQLESFSVFACFDNAI